MKKHLKIYQAIWKMRLMYSLSHRTDTLVQALFAPMYLAMLYFVMQVVLSKTPSLAGWSREEIYLSFAVSTLMLSTAFLLYMNAVRYFMWNGIRQGDLDKILTKPVNTLFYVTMSQPTHEALLWTVGSFSLLLHSLSLNTSKISLTNFLVFLVAYFVCHYLNYLTVSLYATTSFFATKTHQALEVLDKSTDYAQYPTPIFPEIIQFLSYTIVPVAFFGYVPMLFLLGKATIWTSVGLVLALIIFSLLTYYSWREGLKRYSSASS